MEMVLRLDAQQPHLGQANAVVLEEGRVVGRHHRAGDDDADAVHVEQHAVARIHELAALHRTLVDEAAAAEAQYLGSHGQRRAKGRTEPAADLQLQRRAPSCARGALHRAGVAEVGENQAGFGLAWRQSVALRQQFAQQRRRVGAAAGQRVVGRVGEGHDAGRRLGRHLQRLGHAHGR